MANFNSTDFIQDYTDLLDLVKNLTNKWDPSVSDEADPGVVLLKAMTFLKDKLIYKQDLSEAQAYLDTVSDRQSAFELLQMLGYVLKNKKSATGNLQVTNNAEKEVELAPFTVFTNAGSSISYFLIPTSQQVVLESGNTYLLPVMEGSIFNIEKDGVDTFSVKDIDESGRFFLEKSDLAQNGVFIGIKLRDKTDYTLWKNLEASTLYPTEQHFFILTTSTGENYIQFPANYTELLGSSTFEVKATYSLGASGNVKAGTLRQIASASEGSTTSDLLVRQTADFVDGSNEETISQGISNYYDSQGVFNTLVTSHDFNAALRAVVNSDILTTNETPTLFSNGFVRTASDRQLEVTSRNNDATFTYYTTDDKTPENQLDILGLKGSKDYEESFTKVDLSNQDISNILSQFKKASALATSIKPYAEDYIKAVAKLSGIILANISTVAEANSVLENVETALKEHYIASKETFGEEINFSDYLQTVLNSDSRILTASLDSLNYSIDISNEEKDKIAALTAISGIVPLYKFSNRSNITDLDIINPGYINQGLGMTNYKLLGENNISIEVIDNGAETIVKTPDYYNLNSLNILQFRKVLNIDDIQYGYGTNVLYKKSYAEDKIITSGATLTQGSIIKAGSKLLISGSATTGIVTIGGFEKVTINNVEYWFNENGLEEDYTVTVSVTLEPSVSSATKTYASILKAGSVAFNGSVVNDKVVNERILNGEEHTLGVNEEITFSTSTSSTTYGTGTVIKPDGLDIPNYISTSLGSSQIVSKMRSSDSIIDKALSYFMILNNKDELTFQKGEMEEYMLEDNEFFIYTNDTLSEYLILGSGTILRPQSFGDSGKVVLTNNKTAEEKDNIQLSQFVKLGTTFIATETALSTFSEGYAIKTANLNDDNLKLKFTELIQDITIYSYENNSYSEYKTFRKDQQYSVRLGVLLTTDQNGMISLSKLGTQSQRSTGITLKINNNLVSDINADYNTLLVNQLSQCFLTKTSQSFLSTDDNSYKFAICKYTGVTSTGIKTDSVSLSPRGMTFEVTDDKEASVSVALSTSSSKKIVCMNANLTDVTLKGVSLIKNGGKTGIDGLIMNNGTSNVSIWLNLEDQAGEQTGNLTFTFASGPGKVEITDYSIIEGYSDEIKSADYDPTFNLDLDEMPAGTIEKKIIEILGDNVKEFNWLYTPSEEFSHPTEIANFFNKKHPYNFKTLPYLDFTELSKSLRVLPITGRLKK